MSASNHHPGHEHAHPPGEACLYKGGPLFNELMAHLPFSILSVTLGLILAGIICFLGPLPAGQTHNPSVVSTQPAGAAENPAQHAEPHHRHADQPKLSRTAIFGLFHLFHPAHMLFSAAATVAMFRRYDRSTIKAIVVGLVGAIVICGISDILMPHVSATILGHRIPLHICIVQHPMLVVPFAFVGVFLGLFAAEGVISSTYFSHSLHVFTSTMASIFYLVASIGQTAWFDDIGVIFLFVILAVMLPCCLSDIVFPLLMTKEAQATFAETGHHH